MISSIQKTKITSIIYLVAIFFILLLVGCNMSTSSHVDYKWFKDSSGRFHTNDIERAQKEIPFDLIFPSFFPKETDKDTFILIGPYENEFFGTISVFSQYLDNKGNVLITLDQENSSSIIMPNPDSVIRLINDIEITQDNNEYDDKGNVISLAYCWSTNDVTYSLVYHTNDSDEGFKIVESMISQIES